MNPDLTKVLKTDQQLVKNITKKLKDSDGDNYIDAVDCDPKDKNKQGLAHDILNKVKAKYGQIKEQQERRNRLRADVEAKILQGEIKSEKDVSKFFNYGSPYGDYAKRLIRQKQIQEAKEKAVFEIQKKIVVEQAKQKIKQKMAPKSVINPHDPNFMNFGMPQNSKPKNQKKTQSNEFSKMMWEL